MNKKEVSEIKKQLNHERCTIDKICGCYVDHEKVKKVKFNRSFLTLPEDEMFKYFDIFKKILTGSIGKNLFNLKYNTENEGAGTPHELLYDLNNFRLEDEEKLETFYDSIITNLAYPENYFIVLIHSNYDVPGKGSDNITLHDASETVYSHTICAICPVNLSKPGLSYNSKTNNIEDCMRDWIVGMPMCGFLFPAFNDRSTDIHEALYYTKKQDNIFPEIIEDVMGVNTPLTSLDQQYAFETVLSDTLNDSMTLDTVKDIHDTLLEAIEENQDNEGSLVLGKNEIKKLLEKSGIEEESMANFDSVYEEVLDEHSLQASQIVNKKTFEMKSPDVTIKINPKRTDIVEVKEIHGRKCIVINDISNIIVNGLDIVL